MNFRPIYFTQKECSVSPFLSEYKEQSNVRICTGATAYTKENGEVVILIFGQGLWFGNRMDRSLINPYQCRAYGIGLCDDPTDPNGRTLGIESEDENIPLTMKGTTCGLMSRYPTDIEMEERKHMVLSHEENWDPSRKGIFAMGRNNVNENDHNNHSLYERHNMPIGFNTMAFRSAISRRRNKIAHIQATTTENRHHGATPDLIANKWGISIDKAKQTLKATTQLAIRSADAPLKRRYRTDLMSQKLRRLSCRFYTDTFFSKSTSVSGHKCAQLFTDGNGMVVIYPMRSKASAGTKLTDFAHDIGIPNHLTMDGAGEQIGLNSTMMKEIRRLKIQWHITEPYSPWQNQAENTIGIIKSKYHHRMTRRKVPKAFWDFGIIWEAEIYSRTAGKDGRTPIERITGDTIDISEWIDFEFWDICWYWNPAGGDEKKQIGRWLGVSHHIGSALCYFIATATGKVISRTSVQHFTKDDVSQPEIQQTIREYHISLDQNLKESGTVMEQEVIFYKPDEEHHPDHTTPHNDQGENYFGLPNSVDIDEVIDNTSPETAADTYDQYIGAEVCIGPNDGRDGKMMGKVTKRLTNTDNNNPGTYNILRWAVEIGRLDIMTEVSCLSQHLCNPRTGHLNAVYSIFNYLRCNLTKNPGRIVYDARETISDKSMFDSAGSTREQWQDFYPDAEELLPHKMIKPLGNPVTIRTYVDANHAGNLANRRSHTGIIIYLNNAPIIWYSKRQNTVETSSFGSEFVALRIATELNEALRYKLRTFGVPINGPSEILCDNKSVVTNSSVPTSVLNKRHNAICYHRVREAQAAGIIRVGWIEGTRNLADLFTKTTMPTNTKHYFVSNIFNNEAAVLTLKDNGDIEHQECKKES